MTSISCALIVRDAEKTLETALVSVARHFDEIVVVDTGSVDQTRELARRFTRRVLEFPWCDDFSAARQFAHESCTSEWVFFLDADDQVYGASELRGLVAAAPASLHAYMLRYVTAQDAAGKPITEFWRERLTRRGSVRWTGRVHEVLVPTIEGFTYERFHDTWVLHHGHGDGAGSMARNIRLLQMELAEHPDNARALFYLGRDLIMTGQLVEGIDLLERYWAPPGWDDERFMALTMIGHALRVLGRYAEAYVSDLRLLQLHPLWPQAYYMLAQDCYFLGRWQESVHFSEIGQGLPAPATNLFLSPADLESGWMIYQAVALWQCGRLEEAAELTLRALRVLPDNAQHQANAVYFERELAARADQLQAAAAS